MSGSTYMVYVEQGKHCIAKHSWNATCEVMHLQIEQGRLPSLRKVTAIRRIEQ